MRMNVNHISNQGLDHSSRVFTRSLTGSGAIETRERVICGIDAPSALTQAIDGPVASAPFRRRLLV